MELTNLEKKELNDRRLKAMLVQQYQDAISLHLSEIAEEPDAKLNALRFKIERQQITIDELEAIILTLV